MMKHLFFAFLPLFAFAQNSEGDFAFKTEENKDQNVLLDDTKNRFGAQLLLGFNISQVDRDRMEGYHKFAFNGGVRGSIIWTPKISTSIDLLYAQKGAQRSILDDPILSRIDLDYVEVPVMLQYRDWRFQFGGGISYSRLINFKVLDFKHNDVSEKYTPRLNLANWMLGGTFFITKNWGLNIMYAETIGSPLETGAWQKQFQWVFRAVYKL